ncbi:hypothetical protein ACVW2L_001466 [Mucilaginibacter sp. HD30]
MRSEVALKIVLGNYRHRTTRRRGSQVRQVDAIIKA